MKKYVILTLVFFSLLFSSCTSNEKKEQYVVEPTEDILILGDIYHLYGGINPIGYPIVFKDYGMSYQYDIYPDKGCVKYEGINETCYDELIGVTYVEWIEWQRFNARLYSEDFIDNDYLLVIQRDEIHVIGYVIIEFINVADTPLFYRGNIIESMSFPKVDGKYQEVDKEYIFNRFDEIKNSTNIIED